MIRSVFSKPLQRSSIDRWSLTPPLLAVLAAAALIAGCSVQLKEKAPDMASSKYAWLAHCETAESHRPSDEKINKGVSKPHWLLSLDQTGSPYQLLGSLEDGFLRLDEGQPSEEALRLGCVAALEASNREHGNEVARIMAFRQGEGVNVAIEFPTARRDSEIQRLIIFGDSLSDTGNLKSRLKMFPAAPYWIGRFSNGPAWPDYIDAMNRLSVQNHAVGGASVTGKDTMPKGTFMQRMHDGGQFFVSGTTQQQISVFEQGFLLNNQLGSPEKTAAVLWAGANDYISKEPVSGLITTFLNSPEGEAGYKVVVERAVAQLVEHVRSLYVAGARRVLMVNVPDLGRTPIVLQNTINYLELKKLLEQLRIFQKKMLLKYK